MCAKPSCRDSPAQRRCISAQTRAPSLDSVRAGTAGPHGGARRRAAPWRGRQWTRAVRTATDTRLVLATLMTRRLEQAGFAGMDQDALEWRPRGRVDVPVTTLPGVGPKVAERLAALGIETLRDLVEYVPRAHLDWAQATGFAALRIGEEATVACTVERQAQVRPTRRRNLRLVEAAVVDGQGGRSTALWFNQSWLAERLSPGTRLLLHGQLSAGGRFKVERHEVDEGAAGLHTVGLVPVYRASETVSTLRLRELTELALPLARWLPDPLPAKLRAEEGLPLRGDALVAYHRPRDRGDVYRRARTARARGARRPALRARPPAQGLRRGGDGALARHARGARRALRRVAPVHPYARAARGDRRARRRPRAHDARCSGCSRATSAPARPWSRCTRCSARSSTGTRARSWFRRKPLLSSTFSPSSGSWRRSTCAACCSRARLPAKQHAAARARSASGEAQLVVGTHALIQEHVAFASLAVAVVDEQHRFGVEQRRALAGSAARSPHVLHMTATPIPRTLAQTVYGDLDVTEIARPPRDRKEIITRLGHAGAQRRRVHAAAPPPRGRAAGVRRCPLVSESETIEARAAEAEAERLRSAELKGLRVGCLHGRLATAERRAVMEAFTRRELDVLVATTVIEVGVDVPNATIMIVQEADRFGLAQLHQLRGRVGRGAEQSYCLLVSRHEGRADRVRAGAAAGARRHDRRVPARGGRPRAARRGRAARHPPGRAARPSLREPHAGPEADRAGQGLVAPTLLDADPDVLGPLDRVAEERFADADHRGLA